MKIAAITKYRHGALFEAMEKVGWSQGELSRRTGINTNTLSRLFCMKQRPTEKDAVLLEKTFVEAGVNFDAHEAWPETFKGFKQSLSSSDVKDIGTRELEAAQGFYERLQLEDGSDDGGFDYQALPNVLALLTEREQIVIERRFGMAGNRALTCDQIGKKLDLTRERIRQIEARALRKLRSPRRVRVLRPETSVDEPRDYSLDRCKHGVIGSLCPKCHPIPTTPEPTPEPISEPLFPWTPSKR